jgi:hypothetical protein
MVMRRLAAQPAFDLNPGFEGLYYIFPSLDPIISSCTLAPEVRFRTSKFGDTGTQIC